MMLFSETETAKQNQKFPFHSFFRFAAEGWGEETRKQCKEIFGFCTRESASVSEAHLSASPRNRGVHFNPKPPRAPRVRCSPHQDFARNTFELCSTDTARLPSLNPSKIRVFGQQKADFIRSRFFCIILNKVYNIINIF